ncbi:DUF5384 family protein [uncultured Pseudomonas sp.]|uniref:DUF5384 family protein n=1 Tax=uncultured Pseudomonas sp. TaxID=114707 RepID=UPI0025D197C8|nr:DUF5384 family protein [uncultured Pseudomonas sp.]
MRAFLLIAALLLVTTATAADLQTQIDTVRQAELGQQAERRAEWEYRLREQQAAWQWEYDHWLAEKRRIEAARASREAERRADKRREQVYEDELRRLDIEERKLRLTQLKTRTERSGEFIDQELHGEAARTDEIQSRADANRNLSEGAKTLMQSEGAAREKEASSWFK